MENQETTNKKLLIVRANGYIFHVDPETDIIEKCFRANDNVSVKDSIGNEFAQYMGVTAIKYLENLNKKVNQQMQQGKMVAKKQQMAAKKKVIVKNTNERINNNPQEYNNNNNHQQNRNKPFAKKPKQKVLIPSQPIFQPHHCEAVLADFMEKNPKASVKERFCIISAFNKVVDTTMFSDLGITYYEIKPDDNLAWINIEGPNKKLISKRNPLFPWSMSWVTRCFSRYVDVLLVPANNYILTNLVRSNYQINILVPSQNARETYLDLISDQKKNIRANLRKNYDRFVGEISKFKNKENYPNVNFIHLEEKDVFVTKENLQSIPLVYNIHENKEETEATN